MAVSPMKMKGKRKVCEATAPAWGLRSRAALQSLTIAAVLRGRRGLLAAGAFLRPALLDGISPGLLQSPRSAVVAVVGGQGQQWVPGLGAEGLVL